MSPGITRIRGAKSSSQISASDIDWRTRSNPRSESSARTRQCTTTRESCRRSSYRKKRPMNPVTPVSKTSRTSVGGTAADGDSSLMTSWINRRSVLTSLWQSGGSSPASGDTAVSATALSVMHSIPGWCGPTDPQAAGSCACCAACTLMAVRKESRAVSIPSLW